MTNSSSSLDLIELKDFYEQGLQKIGTPKLMPWEKAVWGEYNNECIPFIMIQNNEFCFGTSERDSTNNIFYSKDPRDVLFWLFQQITSKLAHDYAKSYIQLIKKYNMDQRRFIFTEQVKLMYKISDQFGARFNDNVKNIISLHPFDDGYPETLDFLDEFLKQSGSFAAN